MPEVRPCRGLRAASPYFRETDLERAFLQSSCLELTVSTEIPTRSGQLPDTISHLARPSTIDTFRFDAEIPLAAAPSAKPFRPDVARR